MQPHFLQSPFENDPRLDSGKQLARPDKKPLRLPDQYIGILRRYYQLLMTPQCRVLQVGCGAGELLEGLECAEIAGIEGSADLLEQARAKVPEGKFILVEELETAKLGQFDLIIISDRLNYCPDVELVLESLHRFSHSHTRLILNSYNTLWRPILSLATLLRLRQPTRPSNWLSKEDIENLLELSGWDLIKTQARILWPVQTPGIERVINRWLAPLLPMFCLAIFQAAKLKPLRGQPESLSVSVVIPARNEAGNIEAAVERTPLMGKWTELIFVEGGSKDHTWQEIQRVKAAYPDRRIKILQQSEKGKGNAVREGFAAAEGDLLMILDADLTMPPEDLPKYYQAVANNLCEFANGCRLVYPMESQAMRFLNMVANKFFGVAFSWLLGQHVKDTLCGTKVLRKSDYERIAANRHYFGEFDPFGDFDLLFGADKLNLKILDIPIHYRDRSYGETNIDRWRHGVLLFRMLGFAALKIKFV